MTDDDFDVPISPDYTFTQWRAIADSSTRVYFPTAAAVRFHRIWGYVALIEERKEADNTTAGYRFEVICKSPYRIRDFGKSDPERSWIYPRIKAYNPNAPVTSSASISIGCILSGFVVANYAGGGRAQLDGWEAVANICRPRIPAFSRIFVAPAAFLGIWGRIWFRRLADFQTTHDFRPINGCSCLWRMDR